MITLRTLLRKFLIESYRIEFEGKEYETTYREGDYTATIVLSDDV